VGRRAYLDAMAKRKKSLSRPTVNRNPVGQPVADICVCNEARM